MKKELQHFHIGECIGGNQDWFVDPMMKLGGCGAVTACDTCIWLVREFGKEDPALRSLYPFHAEELTKQDYIRFSRVMKPYLRPRPGGISKLSLFTDGFRSYLNDCRAKSFYSMPRPGKRLAFGCRVWKKEEAERAVCDCSVSDQPLAENQPLAADSSQEVSRGRRLAMEGFDGSESAAEAWDTIVQQIDQGFPVPMLVLRHQNPDMEDYIWHWFLLTGYDDTPLRKVQTVTYGESAWVDFEKLWDTGHEEKGGLVIYRWEDTGE